MPTCRARVHQDARRVCRRYVIGPAVSSPSNVVPSGRTSVSSWATDGASAIRRNTSCRSSSATNMAVCVPSAAAASSVTANIRHHAALTSRSGPSREQRRRHPVAASDRRQESSARFAPPAQIDRSLDRALRGAIVISGHRAGERPVRVLRDGPSAAHDVPSVFRDE